MAMEDEQITITITKSGIKNVILDKAEYTEAKEAGELDALLDIHISDMEQSVHVIEPDDTEIEIY